MARVIPPRSRLIRPRQVRKPATFTLDPQHPLSRKLVSFWPLGDTVSGKSTDISQYGKHALVNVTSGAPVLSPARNGGLAYDTNSGTNFLNSSNPLAVTYPISFSVLARCSSLPASSGDEVMMALVKASGLEEFWIGLFHDPGGTTYFRTIAQSDSGANNRWYGVAIGDTNWHHYVGIFLDSSTHAIVIDGIPQSGSYHTGGTGTPSPAAVDTAYIGGFNYNTSSYYGQWSGQIECARIYNRALTTAEAQLLFAEPYAGVYQAPAYWVGSTIVNYVLTAAFGAFVETGFAAGMGGARVLTAAFGSFTETGQAASLKVARKIIAAFGSFTLTGRAASLGLVARLTATAGSFALTGKAAVLKVVTGIGPMMTGMFALSGQAVEFLTSKIWTKQDCTDSPWSDDDEDCNCE